MVSARLKRRIAAQEFELFWSRLSPQRNIAAGKTAEFRDHIAMHQGVSILFGTGADAMRDLGVERGILIEPARLAHLFGPETDNVSGCHRGMYSARSPSLISPPWRTMQHTPPRQSGPRAARSPSRARSIRWQGRVS